MKYSYLLPRKKERKRKGEKACVLRFFPKLQKGSFYNSLVDEKLLNNNQEGIKRAQKFRE